MKKLRIIILVIAACGLLGASAACISYWWPPFSRQHCQACKHAGKQQTPSPGNQSHDLQKRLSQQLASYPDQKAIAQMHQAHKQQLVRIHKMLETMQESCYKHYPPTSRQPGRGCRPQ